MPLLAITSSLRFLELMAVPEGTLRQAYFSGACSTFLEFVMSCGISASKKATKVEFMESEWYHPRTRRAWKLGVVATAVPRFNAGHRDPGSCAAFRRRSRVHGSVATNVFPFRTEADVDFIRKLPFTVRLPDHADLLLVHAGLVPGRPPLEQAWHKSASDRCNMLSRSCESRIRSGWRSSLWKIW